MDTNVFQLYAPLMDARTAVVSLGGTFYNVGPRVIRGVELGISLIYVLYEVMMTCAQINEGGQI